MSETEQTSNIGEQPIENLRTILHELLGVYVRMKTDGTTRLYYHIHVDPKYAFAFWPEVIERLASHPKEASIRWPGDPYPLLLALKNEATPITVEVLHAFIQAYPDVVTRPRSQVMGFVLGNPILAAQQEIVDVLLQANPKHLSGPHRSRIFQIMGFPPIWQGQPFPTLDHYYDYTVDWRELETHLREHPEEASILCPQECGTKMEYPSKEVAPNAECKTKFIFPLEAAVRFETSPVPLSTVELLLRLCPEAATIPDSSALIMVCTCQNQADPHVIEAILHANPSMAAKTCHYLQDAHDELGLPIQRIMFNPSMACVAQIVPQLIAACPLSLADDSNIYHCIPLQFAAEHYQLTPDFLRVLLQNGHRYNVNDLHDNGQLYVRGDCCNDSAMCSLLWRIRQLREWDASNSIPPEIPRWLLHQERREMVWQNYCLALQATGAYRVKVMSADDMWDYPLLHGAIEFGQEQMFFDKIFQQNASSDITRLDPLGRTPLVVAIEAAGSMMEVFEEGLLFEEEEHNLDICLVLKMLLDDGQGGSATLAIIPYTVHGIASWPLDLALQRGVPKDGIDLIANAIANASPRALSIPDPNTGLIPCLMAAVDDASLSTIYCLMIRSTQLIVELIQSL